MVDSTTCAIARSVRLRQFVSEAFATDAAIERGAPTYTAEDVHAWLVRLAKGETPVRPVRSRR